MDMRTLARVSRLSTGLFQEDKDFAVAGKRDEIPLRSFPFGDMVQV